MKTKRTSRHLAITGAMVALGLLLPSLFHLVGAGTVFLPMHIPVLIAAFIIPMQWALAVAAIIPVLSFFIMNMPPLFPVLPIMLCELAGYAVCASFLSRKLRLNVYFSLIISMVFGRLVMFFAAFILQTVTTRPFGAVAYFTNAVATGLPGIVLQIVLLPVLISVIKKAMGYPSGKPLPKKSPTEKAIAAVREDRSSCIAFKDGRELFSVKGRGILPLMELFSMHRESLIGAEIFDKAIGTAAAAVLVSARVRSVYTVILSQDARDILTANNIPVFCDILVPVILNRAKDGICMVEKRMAAFSDIAAWTKEAEKFYKEMTDK